MAVVRLSGVLLLLCSTSSVGAPVEVAAGGSIMRRDGAVDPSEPPKLMRAFFEALREHAIDHLHDNLTTTDFHIYEGNISFSKDGWFDYVRSKVNSTSGEWTLSEFVVSVDEKSAHVYYDDRAVFVNTTSGAKSLHHWIESAYMVVEAGLLKVKFISSTAVNW